MRNRSARSAFWTTRTNSFELPAHASDQRRDSLLARHGRLPLEDLRPQINPKPADFTREHPHVRVEFAKRFGRGSPTPAPHSAPRPPPRNRDPNPANCGPRGRGSSLTLAVPSEGLSFLGHCQEGLCGLDGDSASARSRGKRGRGCDTEPSDGGPDSGTRCGARTRRLVASGTVRC
jgi:hypothetical protein